MMEGAMDKHMFIFGCGFTGTRLAVTLLRQPGWTVSGTTRSEGSAESLKALGIHAVVFDPSIESESVMAERRLEVSHRLRHATHVIMCAPPTADHSDSFLHNFKDVLVNDAPNLAWAGYLSTTGVYGNWDGAEVDETSECRPISKRGKLRAAAEAEWMASGLPVHIFRLPGIYGPQRGTLVKIRSGTQRRIRKEGHCFSRIHVDDIVNAVIASTQKPNPKRVYNVVDDFPCPQHEIVEFGCQLLGLEVPPLIEFKDADMSAMARSFYGENKRVSNVRLKTELLPSLTYPTYKEGLPAQYQEEQAEEAKQRLSLGKRSKTGRLVLTTSRTTQFVRRLPLIGHLLDVLLPEPSRIAAVLVDNGSLRAASTISLRRLSAALQAQLGLPVFPVSCRYSTRIPKEEMNGVAAELLEGCLFRLAAEGYDKVVVVPLFFGPSSSITNFVPGKIMNVRKQHPRLAVYVADTLISPHATVPVDPRLVQAMVSRIQSTAQKAGVTKPRVAVVDHGSPLKEVHEVRVRMTNAVSAALGGFAEVVIGASMERREGDAYAFNEPLLEGTLFNLEGNGSGDFVVAMMFLQPGRHAGSGGDVATILKEEETQHPGLKTHITDLMGSGDDIIPILADRFSECLASAAAASAGSI